MKKLSNNISVLPGIGAKSAEKFSKLGIDSIEDALLYFPFRYEDFEVKSVFDLQDGEKAVLKGHVVSPATLQYYGKRNRLRFSIKQGEIVVSVSFFNQSYLADKVVPGQELVVWGKWDKAKASLTGLKILSHQSEDLQPVYHVSQGISQASIVKLIRSAVDTGYLDLVSENIPEILLCHYQLMDRKRAIYAMHFPNDLEEYRQALRRVKFEELLYFQLQLQLLKHENRNISNGLEIQYVEDSLQRKIETLPFSLTDAQENALNEILQDMKHPGHMNRLLQGDVGSGKTVVAGLAMYATVTAGMQAAIMVPTEILAEQHYETLSSLFPECKISLLTGSMKVGEKREALEHIASGEVHMIVGTHALIQESVTYHKLGLVITDEQHRFGVKQRKLFREKGENPDVLMMTATPIPRTLAITAFGDMEVSIIDQLPAGRKPIVTRWVKHAQLPVLLSWLEKELKKEAQIYFISPLIEESEMLDLKNAIDLKVELEHHFGSKASIELLHGKMKNDEKEAIMQEFKHGNVDILVSTTVIEVGVNVPNATIMIIMDADRFGLSQLHQLRGRVGRGVKQSYAILVADPKTESGKERMATMTETTDGFVLAEVDLKMRGSGEIFGTRQSGLPEFQVANIIEDHPILEEARRVAQRIVTEENWRNNPMWFCLLENLEHQSILD